MHVRSYPRSQRAASLAQTMRAPIPTVDPWGHPYFYERLEENSFRVGSPGPDGRWERGRLADYHPARRTGDDLVVDE